jgi:hypothetical protein
MKATPFCLLVVLIAACTTPPTKDRSFAEFFENRNSNDTLNFAVQAGQGMDAPLASRDTIATAVFNQNVSDSLRAKIAHILEVDEPVIASLGKFPLDDQHDALGVNIKAHWFLNQSLLIFDKKLQKVVDLLPVAEFYGGDGGQILQQSWLFQTPNGAKELLVRTSEHALRLKENAEQPTDLYTESVARYHWQNGTFLQQPISDSAGLIRQFPVEWN